MHALSATQAAEQAWGALQPERWPLAPGCFPLGSALVGGAVRDALLQRAAAALASSSQRLGRGLGTLRDALLHWREVEAEQEARHWGRESSPSASAAAGHSTHHQPSPRITNHLWYYMY